MADGSVIIDARINSKEYTQSLTSMRQEADRFAAAASRDFNSVAKSGLNLTTVIKGLVVAFAGFKAVELGKDAVMAAARYETLGIVAETAGKNIGKSAEEVKQYEKDLKDVGIAAIEARQSIAQMAAAGIDLDFGAQIARAAQDLAVVGDINSSEAFIRMTRAIQSGEVEILKTMGLNVQWEASYEELAKSLDKNVSALTAQEKIQARTNAVLKQSAGYAGIYEAAMGTAGKQISSLTRYISDLSVKVGGVGLDALASGVSRFTDMLKEANAQLDKWEADGTLESVRKGLGDAFTFVADNIGTATVALATFAATQKMVAERNTKAAITKRAELAVTRESATSSLAEAQSNIRSLQTKLALNQAAQAEIRSRFGVNTAVLAGLTLKKQEIALEAQLVVAKNAVAEANKKLAATGIVARGVTALTSAVKGLVSAVGGLAGLGITAGLTLLSMLVTKLASSGNEAEKAARLHGAALEYSQKSMEDAAGAAKTLEEELRKMGKIKLIIAADDARRELQSIRGDLRNVLNEFRDPDLGLFEGHSLDKASQEMRQLFNTFREGGDYSQAALEKLRNEMDALATTAQSARIFKKLWGNDGEGSLNMMLTYTTTLETHTKLIDEFANREKLAAAIAQDLKESNMDIVYSLDEIAKSKAPKTIEDAYKVYEKLVAETKEGKQAAIENAKAEALLAIELLKNAAAAEAAAAATAKLAAEQIALTDDTPGAATRILQKTAEYEAHKRAAEELTGKVTKLQEVFGKTDWGKLVGGKGGSSSGGRNVQDTLKEIQKSIAELNATDTHSFTYKLAKGLEDIEEKAKKAGIGLAQLDQLKEEFSKALAGNYLREMEADLAEIEGRAAEHAMQQLAKDAEEYAAALRAVGTAEGKVIALQQQYIDAKQRQAQMDHLQEQLGFLKEMAELSGDYGLSVKVQNQLIDAQAQKYRTLFAAQPEMKAMVDEWQRLQELQASDNWSDGITRSAKKFISEWSNAATVAEQQFGVLITGIQSIGTAAIDALFGDVEFRVDQIFKDIAKQLAQIMMNRAIASVLTFAGFDEGGYTGDGNPKDVAGVVHKGEFVVNATATKAIGVNTLSAMQASKSLPSFSGASALDNKFRSPINAPTNTSIVYSPNIEVNYTASEGESSQESAQQLASAIGTKLQKDFDTMIDRRLITQMRPGGLLNQGVGR